MAPSGKTATASLLTKDGRSDLKMPASRQKNQASDRLSTSPMEQWGAKRDFERFVQSLNTNSLLAPGGAANANSGAGSLGSNNTSTGNSSAKGSKGITASAVAAATATATNPSTTLQSPPHSKSNSNSNSSNTANAATAAAFSGAFNAGGVARHSVSPHWDDHALHDMYNTERDWRWLKFLVPAKNFVTCYVLVPGILGECGSEHMCIPWLNLLMLVIDIVVFSSHLVLAMKSPSYRKNLPTRNFYLILVVWSLYNVASHPVSRQNLIDFFSVAPPEIHLTINLLATFVCSTTTGLFPTLSLARLLSLLLGQLLLSLFLSFADLLAFHVSSGFLSAVRLDIVMFNVAILLVGATIIIGSMTIEKDFKSLAHDADSRFPHSNAFEEDLERRKRAVLTALCDAVFTTDANFVVTGSEEGADKIFRRSMHNENLTNYFKDRLERDHFMAAVRKQFPENGVSGEGPKRMRAVFRDARREPFEADVVISDASTDEYGKVTRYMIGMHIRSGEKVKALGERRRPRTREGSQMYDVLTQELFRCCDGYLRLPEEPPYLRSDEVGGGSPTTSSSFADPRQLHGVGEPQVLYQLRRANCEVYRKKVLQGHSNGQPRLGGGRGHPHDLRQLALPETSPLG